MTPLDYRLRRESRRRNLYRNVSFLNRSFSIRLIKVCFLDSEYWVIFDHSKSAERWLGPHRTIPCAKRSLPHLRPFLLMLSIYTGLFAHGSCYCLCLCNGIWLGCPVFTRPSLSVACLITTLSHYVIALRKYMCVNLRGFKKTGRTLPLKALLAYQTCQKWVWPRQRQSSWAAAAGQRDA